MATPVPLRTKLSAITLITTGFALLITSLLFLLGQFLVERQTTREQLQILSEAIASNSTAALAFENPEDAEAVLAAFRSDPHIVAAALFRTDGRLFASWPADPPPGALPSAPGEPGYHFERSSLIGVSEVREQDLSLGMLVVRSDLKDIYERLGMMASLAALIISLALMAAWLVSRRLQRQIANPILSLAATAEVVSTRHDYTVRAQAPGINELDALTGAFNHMLTQTAQYEHRLNAQVSRLALLQEITHSIGSRHDLLSIFQVVLGSLEDHMPISFGCVCLHEPASGNMTVESVGPASLALAKELGLTGGASIPVGQNGLYKALHGTLIHEPDVAETHSPFTERFVTAGLYSLVLAPLTVESNVFGVLVAARREAKAFSSTDCEFLKQLSEHVALAAHQAQLYVALQRAYDDLRQSQQSVMQNERLRALGQMASGIAHDINNAISPVSLYTELLLQKESQLSDEGRGRLETMQQAIEDVAGTIERMREFYRPREAARHFTRVEIHSLVNQVVELTEPRGRALPEQRGIEIELRRDFAEGKIEIFGDAVELRDALTNLVFNAVDAMPEGGRLTLSTRVRPHNSTPRVLVEVSDSGVGMDEETRRRCIEPFFTTKGERGTGLGLASVYGMLQRHDAELEIDSEPGNGTTVRMVFPGIVDRASVATVAPPPRVVRRNLRILVVDDDPVLSRSLEDALLADAHHVQLASGGRAGIDAFLAAHRAGHDFDLVITDLGMPRVDGRKVAEAIKGVSPGTPIIMLTGWGQRLLDEGDIPSNIDRVLSKPPRLQQLRACITELIE
jgi:signal transduction histidine kinase